VTVPLAISGHNVRVEGNAAMASTPDPVDAILQAVGAERGSRTRIVHDVSEDDDAEEDASVLDASEARFEHRAPNGVRTLFRVSPTKPLAPSELVPLGGWPREPAFHVRRALDDGAREVDVMGLAVIGADGAIEIHSPHGEHGATISRLVGPRTAERALRTRILASGHRAVSESLRVLSGLPEPGDGLLVTIRGTARLASWTLSGGRVYALDAETFHEVSDGEAVRLLGVVDAAYGAIARSKTDDDDFRNTASGIVERALHAFEDSFGDASSCFEWHRALTRLRGATERPIEAPAFVRVVQRCARSEDLAPVTGRKPTRSMERKAALAVCDQVVTNAFRWISAGEHRERVRAIGHDMVRILERSPTRSGAAKAWREHVRTYGGD
jgi:hypothetical protein